MALKSKEWFYKTCLKEVEKHGRFSHLCWDILEKGMGQKDSTRGHVTQAIGACQDFLSKNKSFIKTIQAADPTYPFDVAGNKKIRQSIQSWLTSHNGAYGRASFGYSYDTLKNILTPTLGGTRKGGGGGGDEFKRVLRLMAEFI